LLTGSLLIEAQLANAKATSAAATGRTADPVSNEAMPDPLTGVTNRPRLMSPARE
jgi:uncharacterized protein GlcG (DUF336 family)